MLKVEIVKRVINNNYIIHCSILTNKKYTYKRNNN